MSYVNNIQICICSPEKFFATLCAPAQKNNFWKEKKKGKNVDPPHKNVGPPQKNLTQKQKINK